MRAKGVGENGKVVLSARPSFGAATGDGKYRIVDVGRQIYTSIIPIKS